MEKKSVPNEIFFANVLEEMSEGLDVRITLVGNSMLPTFVSGVDQVVLTRCDKDNFSSLVAGDVVLFRRSDRHICLHRVIKVEGNTLYIRGDGNIGPFELAHPSDLLGKVVGGTYRGGRSFSTDDRQWTRNTVRVMRTYPFKYVYRKLRHLAGEVLRRLGLRS